MEGQVFDAINSRDRVWHYREKGFYLFGPEQPTQLPLVHGALPGTLSEVSLFLKI